MRKQSQWVLGITLAGTLITPTVFAAGFQISETSVTGVGRSFAGHGVAGDSISEMFANPASLGLRREHGTEVEIGIHSVSTTAAFENRGSSQTFLSPGGSVTVPSTGPNSDGGDTTGIPNLFVAWTINDHIRAGIGITVPFGLKTEYDANWVGRYAAIKSELEVVEINPAITYRVGGHTMGFGLNFLKADAELTSALFTGSGSPDGLVRLEGDDTAVGWNIGVVGENDIGRFGASFRSATSLDIAGDVNISPVGITGGLKSEVQLPKTVYLSGLLKKSEKLDLLASIRWTDWSSFRDLVFVFDNGLPASVTPTNWSSTLMTSIGFNYRKTDQWTYRGGLAFDDAAIHDPDITVRIPDANRVWLSFGGSYSPSENLRVDISYAHIFVDSVDISESTNLVGSSPGASTDNLRGNFTDTDADILSIALSYKFGKKAQ